MSLHVIYEAAIYFDIMGLDNADLKIDWLRFLLDISIP